MKYFDIYLTTTNGDIFLERTESILEARYRIEFYLNYIIDRRDLKLYYIDGKNKIELDI